MGGQTIERNELTEEQQWSIYDEIAVRVKSGKLRSLMEIKEALLKAEIGEEVLASALAGYMGVERIHARMANLT